MGLDDLAARIYSLEDENERLRAELEVVYDLAGRLEGATVQDVERTREQLVRFLDGKVPSAKQVVIDLECFIRAVIVNEVGKRW